MSSQDVSIITAPDLTGRRHEFVLREDRVGHYDEFRAFFVRTFDLYQIGLSEPGYLRAPSGMEYVVIFLGRSGEPFPAGVELFALPEALEPLNDASVDRDLWAIMGWMIDGVGPPWTREDLETTGRVYRVPAAM